jgi:predicted acylesterase/phospholipase RssA/ABC-type phosphate/phosphonate transport system substrate-binding protein
VLLLGAGALLLATTASALSQDLVPDRPDPPLSEVRVGVVAIDDFHAEQRKWNELLNELSASQTPTIRFRLAIGTYADVRHWLDEATVDVAALPPGAFAADRQEDSRGQVRWKHDYLATVGIPAASSDWAGEDRRQPGYHFAYRCICVVPAGSPVQSVEDLARQLKKGDLVVNFVHPLSASGHLFPRGLLEDIGWQPRRQQLRFTHSHSESLRQLAEGGEKTAQVAFVWDDALAEVPGLAGSLRRVPIPRLDSMLIPQDVVVARRGYQQASQFRELLLQHRDRQGEADFVSLENWEALYTEVGRQAEKYHLNLPSTEGMQVTLDEIGSMLLHAIRSQPTPPRLAVVLSGGGAKCSYQVGAMIALEEKLAELREQTGEPLDIDLVVGTSGGAINAIPVALGISTSKEGQEQWKQVWLQLDQREVLKFDWKVRLITGIWCGSIQLALLLLLSWPLALLKWRSYFVSSGMLALGVVELLLVFLPITPWKMMGDHHLLHHSWLCVASGLPFCSGLLVILGAGCLVIQVRRSRHGGSVYFSRRRLVWGMTVVILGLPIVQLVNVLFLGETFSQGEGIEQSIEEGFSRMVDGQLKRSGRAPFRPEGDNARQRLQSLSLRMIKAGLFKRDLVISANCLEQSSDQLPSDLFFFLPGQEKSPRPHLGDRGIALQDYPDKLLDVVIGSGTIYPVFPARRLYDFPVPGEHVELVDGGFAHNSPVEAAVLWDATHIIQLLATPEKRRPRKNLATNALAAYSHLFKQSQLADNRSAKQVSVFTLQPDPPHLCVLDFADILIEKSIERGYNDARGEIWHDGRSTTGVPRFRKSFGVPTFSDIRAIR